MEVAGPHDEVDFGDVADIGDGVTAHGHDVGGPARFENSDVLAAEEFGGGAGGGAQGAGWADACCGFAGNCDGGDVSAAVNDHP